MLLLGSGLRILSGALLLWDLAPSGGLFLGLLSHKSLGLIDRSFPASVFGK